MKTDISVIVPLYNKGCIIERTVKSVLNQTYPHFELIVVDDGSTDNSADIVKQFNDERIQLIQQPNAGPSAARNKGVQNARTEWIVFLDGDDELLPEALNHFAELRNNFNKASIYNCRSYIRHNEKLKPTTNTSNGYVDNNLKECFLGRCMPGAGFSMFSKTALLRQPYNEDIRRFEDAEFLIRLLPNNCVYSDDRIVHIHDVNYAEASSPRKNISEDYAGHLSMKGKSFWGKMCVYRTYLENREIYPTEMHKLYPSWNYRYDLLLLYKFFNKFFK